MHYLELARTSNRGFVYKKEGKQKSNGQRILFEIDGNRISMILTEYE